MRLAVWAVQTQATVLRLGVGSQWRDRGLEAYRIRLAVAAEAVLCAAEGGAL